MDYKWIRLGALLGIIACILMILIGIYITPDYVAINLSPDGILKPTTINKINIIRIGAVIAGILIMIFSIAPDLLYYILNWFRSPDTKTYTVEPISTSPAVVTLLITFLLSVAPLFFVTYPPLLDYPSHLARVYIIDNWSESPLLQHWYILRSFILPNMGMDITVLLLSKIFPVDVAGRIFIALTFWLTLSGCMFLYNCVHGHFSLWPLVSSLFLFNWIFILGFMNYLFGVAVLLWAIGFWILFCRSKLWIRMLCGTIASVGLFFCHLSSLGLYAITIAAYELHRSIRTYRIDKWIAFRNLLICASTFIVPLFLFMLSSTGGETSNKINYNPPLKKLKDIIGVFWSGIGIADVSIVIAILLIVITLITIRGKLLVAKSMYLPLAMLVITYAVMPFELLGGGFVDSRLPIAILFIAISCSQLKLRTTTQHRLVLITVAVFLAIRSIALCYYWSKYDEIIQEYTVAYSGLPYNSIMFVATKNYLDGYLDFKVRQPPVLHISDLAILHQRIFVPATPANPSQQPIGISKRYRPLKYFQGQDPIRVRNEEELNVIINRIRHLTADLGMRAIPSYLLLHDAKSPNLSKLNHSKVVASSSRFTLFYLSPLESEVPDDKL